MDYSNNFSQFITVYKPKCNTSVRLFAFTFINIYKLCRVFDPWQSSTRHLCQKDCTNLHKDLATDSNKFCCYFNKSCMYCSQYSMRCSARISKRCDLMHDNSITKRDECYHQYNMHMFNCLYFCKLKLNCVCLLQ